ncbi:MAG: ATP-binding protein [Frankiales bacterium]|jgi:hypothetical protein|nr:ATP-binding protein [Frankiales bacterium]
MSTAPEPTQTTDATVAPSSLPPLPRTIVRTPDFRRGQLVCRLATRLGTIGTLGGPSGAGKTTTVVAYLKEHGVVHVYVQLPQNARVRDVIARIWEALTGHPSGKMRQRDMENDLVLLLADGGTCVVADEVHNVGVVGMQALRYLHDRVVAHRNRGLGPDSPEAGGFPLLLVGSNVAQAIASTEELDTRAGLGYEFEAVPKDRVVAVARQLHPVLAATSERTIEVLDNRYCKGNLRRWSNIVKNLQELRDEGDASGLTTQQAKDLLMLAGKR